MAYGRKKVGYVKRIARHYRRAIGRRYVKKSGALKLRTIVRDVARLKGLVNTEIKYLDQQHNGGSDGYWDIQASATVGVPAPEATPPTAGYVSIPIDYPTQGDDFNQREGRSLRLKGVQIKGTIKTAQSLSSYGGKVRVMIVVDKQAGQGTDTDPVPWMYNTDNNGEYTLQSSLNRQQMKRYRIIASKKYDITLGKSPSIDVNIYKRLNDKVLFNGTTNSAFMDKMFHVIVFPDSRFPVVGASDMAPAFVGQFFSRITYIDN